MLKAYPSTTQEDVVELLIAVLVPFPLGFLVKRPIWAYITYIAIHAFVFTFQSLNLLIEWVGGSQEAFGPYPQASAGQVWSYGVVNLVIYLVGLGLVALGSRVRAWWGRRSMAVSLDPVH
jgi:hypothetical protein